MLEDAAWERGPAGAYPAVLSVSALLHSVRDLLEHRYPLQWISGEISNFVLARSGHVYFTLKDAQAQVRCVMFRQRKQCLDWAPRDGMQVEVRALVTLYEARGDFQLIIEQMRRAGAGLLYERFQRLREKLAHEGLFSEAQKRPLPPFPRAIGLISSTAGAALQDVLTTLARRNPCIPVIVHPVPVQGEGAGRKIAEALSSLGAGLKCDVIILARGGGSIEDLWAFNEEIVARAIRSSAVPVVTGIGHETDFTIADFAADCRAPTPTAAAELASPDRAALLQHLRALAHRLVQYNSRCMEQRMQRLDILSMRLQHPGQRLEAQGHRLANLRERLRKAFAADLTDKGWHLRALMRRSLSLLPRPMERAADTHRFSRRMGMALQAQLELRTAKLARLEASLLHLDPDRILKRGYSVVRNAEGNVVSSATQFTAGDTLDITFAEGGAKVRVESPV